MNKTIKNCRLLEPFGKKLDMSPADQEKNRLEKTLSGRRRRKKPMAFFFL